MKGGIRVLFRFVSSLLLLGLLAGLLGGFAPTLAQASSAARPLGVDPAPGGTLHWNTFLGGKEHDFGNSIAVDASGNSFVAGTSVSTWGNPVREFSVSRRRQTEVFVAKLDSDGKMVWNTFLGDPSRDDRGFDIALDGSGNLYVVGYFSPLRKTKTREQVFVAKLNSSGQLLWSTEFGGNGTDHGTGIAVDASGTTYVIGSSGIDWGTPKKPYTAKIDVFVASLNSMGILQWSTFLGGKDNDYGMDIALGGGVLYVTGGSGSTWGAPVTTFAGGASDAFTAMLDTSGNLNKNTFLGGAGIDEGKGIAVDGSGTVFLTGYSTQSWGAPVRPHFAARDAFVASMASNLAPGWNTFLGGTGGDTGRSIALDTGGNIYAAGTSETAWGAPTRTFQGV
jgi:hypothetical protein